MRQTGVFQSVTLQHACRAVLAPSSLSAEENLETPSDNKRVGHYEHIPSTVAVTNAGIAVQILLYKYCIPCMFSDITTKLKMHKKTEFYLSFIMNGTAI